MLVAGTAVLALPLQRRIAAAMEQLKADIITYLEEITNREIRYGGFSPSILRFIEIRDMRILSRKEPDRELIQINRVRVYYSLFRLLRRETAGAFTRVSLESSEFVIDAEKDEDLITFLRELVTTGADAEPAPEGREVRISGKDLSLVLIADAGTIRFDRVFFDIETRSRDYDYQLNGLLSAEGLNVPVGIENIRAQTLVSGSVHRTLDQATLRVGLSNLETDTFSLIDQTFQIHFLDGTWTLRKIQDSLPVDISIAYESEQHALQFSIISEQFVPSSYLDLKKAGALPEGILETSISGNAGGTYNLTDNSLEYRGDLRMVLDTPAAPAVFDIDAQFDGNDDELRVGKLIVDSELGRADFTGVVGLPDLLPDGTLTFTNVRYPLGRPISGTVKATMQDDVLSISAGSLRVGTSDIFNLSGEVSRQDGAVVFSAEAGLPGGMTGEDSPSNVTARGTVAGNTLEMDASLRNAPAEALYTIAMDGPPDGILAGELARMFVEADVFVRSDFERYSFSVFSFQAHSTDGSESIDLVMSGNESMLNVASLTSTWRGVEVDATARLALGNGGPPEFSSTLQLFDASYTLQGSVQNDRVLRISGSHDLALRVDLPDRRYNPYTFSLSTTRFPIVIDETTYHTTLQLSGHFSDVEDWSVNVDGARLSPVPLLSSVESELSLSAVMGPSGGTIDDIFLSDRYSAVTGGGSLSISSTDPLSLSGDLTVRNEATAERYGLQLSLDGRTVDAELEFGDLPVLRFAELPLAGMVTGSCAVEGELPFPDIRIDAGMEDGVLNGDPISWSGSVSLDDSGVSAESVTVDYLSARVRSGRGSVDFTNGAFSVTGDVSAAIQNQRLLGVVAVEGAFTEPIERENLSELAGAGYAATAALRDVRLGGVESEDWEFSVDHVAGLTGFTGGPDNAIEGVVNDDGSFQIVMSAPLPVAMSARGRLAHSELEAELNDVYLNMEGIESIVTIPFFNVTAGEARGNLRIKGPLVDPDIHGELQGRDLLARVPVVPEVIGPFTARLSFDGKTLVIGEALMRAGDGEVAGLVEFTIDHWMPRIFDIEITTQNATGIHIQSNFGGIDVDGYANGVLNVSGDVTAIEVEGTLVVHNTDIMIRRREGSRGNAPTNLIVDLTFITAKQVAFLWPNPTFPILRSIADTDQQLRLQSNSIAGTYSIRGDVRVRGGEIFYFQRNFYLRQGQIRFNENQQQFDPVITARAETRDVSPEGERLTLYLVIDDQPFSTFNPRFESDPPMSSLDILAYLGQDIISEGAGDQFGLSSALMLTTDVLEQFAIVRNIENRVRDVLKLDLFSLRTQILQNIISDAVLPEDSTVPGTGPSLGKYLDNTTLFLGKYFGNDLFLEAMIRLRANQNLLSNVSMADDLYVDSEIRLEWRTPLFLLELSLLPDFADLLTSITNTSIGLSWGFSY